MASQSGTDYFSEALYDLHRYEGHPHMVNGDYYQPRISQAIAKLVSGDHDVSKFEPDERAQFIFGLAKLLELKDVVGEIEHTNDWDWYVQIQTSDGKWYGDYARDGLLEPEGEDWDGPYCDDFGTRYDNQTYQWIPKGDKERYDHYYSNLVVEIEVWDTAGMYDSSKKLLKVGEISRILIGER